MLCIEYIVWESKTEDFKEYLDKTQFEDLPDIL